MSKLARIVEDALHLPNEERAILAQKLLDSLEDLTAEETEAVWFQEAERRRSRFRDGRDLGVASATVHEKAQRLLK